VKKLSFEEVRTTVAKADPAKFKSEVDAHLDGYECIEFALANDHNLVEFSPRASFMVGLMTGFLIHKLSTEDERAERSSQD
jgi:hypothetical protein